MTRALLRGLSNELKPFEGAMHSLLLDVKSRFVTNSNTRLSTGNKGDSVASLKHKEAKTMNGTLKRMALMFVIVGLSLPIYARPADEKRVQKTDKVKQMTVESSRVKVNDSENENTQQDGPYWFNRGYALHQSDHYVEAIEAFSHSIGLGYRQPTAIYNVACGYAHLNDKDNALFWLERAFASGFDRADLLKTDSDLDPLRSDPRFKEIEQKVSLMRPDDKPLKEKSEKDKQKQKSQKERDRLDEALINFEQLRTSSSEDGDLWYTVGSRLLGMRDHERATFALTQAVEHLGPRGSNAMYNLACNYALAGNVELGLQWLERSVNAGFDGPDKLLEDSDIANLRGDPRFRKIQELSRALSLSQFTRDGDGDSQYSKQRWAPAVKHYQSFLQSDPNNGRAWFNLGFALHYSSEHARAIDAFQRAIQNGYRPPTSMYNIACANAMMGNRDEAFEWLEKSYEAGFNVEDYAGSDSDLDSLRSDPRFKKFLEMADHEHKEKHK
jgi:tetratricopeptide (TPR) repeat protein